MSMKCLVGTRKLNIMLSILIFVVSLATIIVHSTRVPLASSAQYLLNPFTPQGRIVGGKEAEIEDFPYQVLLEVKGVGFCGGSILADDWVLTAGHCIIYPDDVVLVRAGSSNKSQGGSVHHVIKTIKHEDYSVSQHGVPINDIALLKIDESFELDRTRQPVDLFGTNETVEAGEVAVITGWGTVKQGGRSSDKLRTVAVPVIERRACAAAYKALGGLPPRQICAAHPDGEKDACQGDSGGPLVVNGRQAGVVSWGNGCAKKGYPGAYTDVAAFREWIADKTGI